ncbi:hypothetical protein CFOLD11_23870 [Clostridium folliculivorans]|uniref:Uncharacterized protein n=1 Tax=Clostridium folliculivorans TaxID=2886038 RepID=A0A9W6DB22_9CLOT|nr:hypothetical protein CFOLD11_23870 [Clostridium folliculivorans]
MSKLNLYLFENPGFWGFLGMYKLIVELGTLKTPIHFSTLAFPKIHLENLAGNKFIIILFLASEQFIIRFLILYYSNPYCTKNLQ